MREASEHGAGYSSVSVVDLIGLMVQIIISRRNYKNGNTVETYTGEKIQPLGTCSVEVKYKNEDAILPLLVIKGNGPNLLGPNWLSYATW